MDASHPYHIVVMYVFILAPRGANESANVRTSVFRYDNSR